MAGHCYSRGSLHSLVGKGVQTAPEDEAWVRKVLAACMDPQDAIYASEDCYQLDEDGYYYEDEDFARDTSSIAVLWGIYRRPEPTFNEKYFSPRGR